MTSANLILCLTAKVWMDHESESRSLCKEHFGMEKYYAYFIDRCNRICGE